MHLPLKQGLRQIPRGFKSPFSCVRVHLPLKQGLRHPIACADFHFLTSTSASSIKTRIKTAYKLYVNIIKYNGVRVHLPLKQGLRQARVSFTLHLPAYVRVHLPLKQGLRLESWSYLTEE